jgi:hypothetical protein
VDHQLAPGCKSDRSQGGGSPPAFAPQRQLAVVHEPIRSLIGSYRMAPFSGPVPRNANGTGGVLLRGPFA